MDRLRTGHFFAGGGGGILADKILGHKTVLAVEIDQDRCQVLQEAIDGGFFEPFEIQCCDIRDFDPGPWIGKLDIMAAGFPCQDISVAGTGSGIKGKRSSLFFDFMQAAAVIQPPIIFLENSPAIRTRGRREVIRCLLEHGYVWRDGTLAASHVGAGHKRDRWWCLAANADGIRKLQQERRKFNQWRRSWDKTKQAADINGFGLQWSGDGKKLYGRNEFADEITDAVITGFQKKRSEIQTTRTTGKAQNTSNLMRSRLEGENKCGVNKKIPRQARQAIQSVIQYTGNKYWLPLDVGICRMVDGVANRVYISKKARISMLGDGQVPLQAAVAWLLLIGV